MFSLPKTAVFLPRSFAGTPNEAWKLVWVICCNVSFIPFILHHLPLLKGVRIYPLLELSLTRSERTWASQKPLKFFFIFSGLDCGDQPMKQSDPSAVQTANTNTPLLLGVLGFWQVPTARRAKESRNPHHDISCATCTPVLSLLSFHFYRSQHIRPVLAPSLGSFWSHGRVQPKPLGDASGTSHHPKLQNDFREIDGKPFYSNERRIGDQSPCSALKELKQGGYKTSCWCAATKINRLWVKTQLSRCRFEDFSKDYRRVAFSSEKDT